MSGMSLCETCGTPRTASSTCCPTCCAQKRQARASTLALLGLAAVVSGCGDKEIYEPAYGIAADYTGYTDFDGDGYSPFEGDCDDADPDVHPGATETVGDGVDSNCDGNDDT